MLTPEQIRSNLDRLITERGYRYAGISRAIGRNAAYIQQFITRGTPRRLEEEDRRLIASMLGCDESEIGGPDPRTLRNDDVVMVKRFAIEASAGFGATVDQETTLGGFGFPRLWLRQMTNAKPTDLSIIRIRGESMAPTLSDGDQALIDGSQRDPRREDGVYVLRRDDALMVKRLTVTPGSGLITVSSDNAAYPTWRDCPSESLRIIGRTVGSISRVR